ncbi:type 4a pilus biogenesis protein PilO [uncultured Winogradskyella sp.]|uniref:type 4a pilus biogenesis protein PilO n=1 Tax=uncultured Winogradskyella sp. TaxID=395353 RepID=UPI002609CC33|nr:type 4a pilus biogenesis protein PilO [uncultured Winogradskyella sp.]
MTQKTKNILLVVGFFLLIIIAYNYAIANTLQLKNEYKTLQQEALAFDNMPLQLSALKQRKHYYDSLLTKYQLSESSMQNNMLSAINTFADANQLKVVDFIEPHKIIQNDLIVNTYQFTLEGNYNAILSLVYQLEQHTKFGEIINLNFKKQKNYKTGRFYLQAHVLLRNFG